MSAGGALGVQAIAAMSAGASDEARLQMWLRAGLNEGSLASCLQALHSNTELCAKWYDRCFMLAALLAFPQSNSHMVALQGHTNTLLA